MGLETWLASQSRMADGRKNGTTTTTKARFCGCVKKLLIPCLDPLCSQRSKGDWCAHLLVARIVGCSQLIATPSQNFRGPDRNHLNWKYLTGHLLPSGMGHCQWPRVTVVKVLFFSSWDCFVALHMVLEFPVGARQHLKLHLLSFTFSFCPILLPSHLCNFLLRTPPTRIRICLRFCIQKTWSKFHLRSYQPTTQAHLSTETRRSVFYMGGGVGWSHNECKQKTRRQSFVPHEATIS